MKALFTILIGAALFHLPAYSQSDQAALVDRFDQLGAAEQKGLLESITGKGWRRHSPDDRLALQKAAVRYSERVLGRDAKGKLKVVKDEVGLS